MRTKNSKSKNRKKHPNGDTNDILKVLFLFHCEPQFCSTESQIELEVVITGFPEWCLTDCSGLFSLGHGKVGARWFLQHTLGHSHGVSFLWWCLRHQWGMGGVPLTIKPNQDFPSGARHQWRRNMSGPNSGPDVNSFAGFGLGFVPSWLLVRFGVAKFWSCSYSSRM